jgi:hypothetical protein
MTREAAAVDVIAPEDRPERARKDVAGPGPRRGAPVSAEAAAPLEGAQALVKCLEREGV